MSRKEIAMKENVFIRGPIAFCPVLRAAIPTPAKSPARWISHHANKRIPDHTFALPVNPSCREDMAQAGRLDFDDPTFIDEEENEETLDAIDEGIRDAGAGRTVPIEEVRKLLPQWITASSSRKER
jgi:predicted transcriptional regulator